MITDDSQEPMIAMFMVEGSVTWLDKTEHGSFAA